MLFILSLAANVIGLALGTVVTLSFADHCKTAIVSGDPVYALIFAALTAIMCLAQVGHFGTLLLTDKLTYNK